MHSHDKTLLAKLGFNDQDRKNPLHDLVCAYICQEHIAAKVAAAAGVKWPHTLTAKPDHSLSPKCDCDLPRSIPLVETWVDAASEVHLQKGEGKYATTIGFLDVVLTAAARWEQAVKRGTMRGPFIPWAEGQPPGLRCDPYQRVPCTISHHFDEEHTRRKTIAVEVKVSHEHAGDVLRQINLYRDYYAPREEDGIARVRWVLASTYQPTQHEHDTFKSAGVTCVRIGGAEFNEFIEKAKTTKAIDVPEL